LTLAPSQSWSINDWADYWRYHIGVNVIPADTRNKIPLVKWTSYQNIPILEEQHNQWKEENAFEKGIAIIVGKIWHNDPKNGLYLTFVDLDNKKAIDEFCTRDGKTVPLDDMAQHMIIEQHRDESNKAHAYFYSRHSFKKKSSDHYSNNTLNGNEIPAIEVKGVGEHGLAFCSPSPHKNGHNYEIIGTPEPEIIDDLESHIDNICKKYQIPYLEINDNGRSLVPIQDLFKEETKIYEGHNRHEALLRVMESLISRNRSILNLDQIKSFAHQWNLQHCSPPLASSEIEKQWNDAVKFIQRCEVRDSEQANELGPDSNPDQNENNNNESNENQAQSNAEILVKLAQENVQLFFKDQYGAAFGLVKVLDHKETVALESSRFKRFLAKIFYDKSNHKVVSTDAITNAIQILQAKTEYEGKTIPRKSCIS